MKKILSLILSCSILAGIWQWDELAKLPVLIRHYSIHLKSDSNLTFAGFLFKHYPESGFDQKDHHGLPFKSKRIISPISIFFPESTGNLTPLLKYRIIEFPDTRYEIQSGLTDILLPPKIG